MRLKHHWEREEGAFQGILTLSQRLSQPSVSLILNITGRSLRSLNIRVNVCIASFTAIVTTVELPCTPIAAKSELQARTHIQTTCTTQILTTPYVPALHVPTVTGKIPFR